MGQTRPPLKTVCRTFEIVEILLETGGAGPTEMAEQLDLPKSTVHEYLRALQSSGYVVQEDGSYNISYRFFNVGGRLQKRNKVCQIAKPELRKLAQETGQFVNYNVVERSRAIILHQERGEESMDIVTYPGLESPLHTHATGKVLLAYMSDADTESVLEGDLERMTDETITDTEHLRSELEQIREQGYAVDWDQRTLGMGFAAVPIVIDQKLAGAIGLACPTGRLVDPSYQDEFVRKLEETSNMITVNYQWGT